VTGSPKRHPLQATQRVADQPGTASHRLRRAGAAGMIPEGGARDSVTGPAEEAVEA
jgi:hypothetical protein